MITESHARDECHVAGEDRRLVRVRTVGGNPQPARSVAESRARSKRRFAAEDSPPEPGPERAART
jgi:hypothetical protein